MLGGVFCRGSCEARCMVLEPCVLLMWSTMEESVSFFWLSCCWFWQNRDSCMAEAGDMPLSITPARL